MNTLNILVVEDDLNDVFFLEKAFKKSGAEHRLQNVRDGFEALTYFKGEEPYADRSVHPFPNVVILDLNMPRMNGFEVMEWMRADARTRVVPVHVFSASTLASDVKRAYALGANSFAVKPSQPAELVSFVAAFNQWHQFILVPTFR